MAVTAMQATRMSEAEWQMRVDLAAGYRLVDLFGWSDLINTRITARVPGPQEHFLINRFGMLYDEITASSLVKIDIEGSEPRAVRGMAQSIERHRPTVLSEFAPSNLLSLGGVDPDSYVAWFLQRGYACSILEDSAGALVPASPPEIAARLGGRHHLDLVFSPAGG